MKKMEKSVHRFPISMLAKMKQLLPKVIAPDKAE